MNKWQAFMNPWVLVTGACLVLFFLFDFFDRVWLPVNTQSTAFNERESEELEIWRFPQYQINTLALTKLLQRPAAAGENSEGLTAEQQAVTPLQGSQALGVFFVRARAVFVKRDGQSTVSFAAIEMQPKQGGEIEHLVVREGDQIEGHEVLRVMRSTIELIDHESEVTRTLKVFNAQQSDPEAIEGGQDSQPANRTTDNGDRENSSATQIESQSDAANEFERLQAELEQALKEEGTNESN